MKKKDKSKPKKRVMTAPLREGSGTVPIRITSKAPENMDNSKQEMLTPSIVIDQQCGSTALAVPNESVPKARGIYVECFYMIVFFMIPPVPTEAGEHQKNPIWERRTINDIDRDSGTLGRPMYPAYRY